MQTIHNSIRMFTNKELMVMSSSDVSRGSSFFTSATIHRHIIIWMKRIHQMDQDIHLEVFMILSRH